MAARALPSFLLKTEPETYSFDRLLAERVTVWDGVRNHEAKNNLARMREGERVFVYHSGEERAIVGLAKVTRAAFPDPTDESGRWLAVELHAERRLALPVTLARLKEDERFARMLLVTRPRLSVMPLTPAEAKLVLAWAKG